MPLTFVASAPTTRPDRGPLTGKRHGAAGDEPGSVDAVVQRTGQRESDRLVGALKNVGVDTERHRRVRMAEPSGHCAHVMSAADRLGADQCRRSCRRQRLTRPG